MRHTLRLPFRLLTIARVLRRHDALSAVEALGIYPTLIALLRRVGGRTGSGRPGQKLARALTELGPSFIKFGQFLATRADLIGEQMAADLSELQDRLPAFSFEEARDILESELGRPLDDLFDHFEQKPISAASIAQVHFAITREEDPEIESREVAVKVLRPGIESAFERDLQLFYYLAYLVERTQPRLRRFKPVEVVGLFEETVRTEMDLRMEAAAASELGENFEGDPDYQVPAVDWERTARRVMTQSRLSGIRLDDRQALLAAGHDLTEVLRKASAIFFNQVFRDGFFHGDQHPGNMFVTADGGIGAVDFGIMGRLDHRTRTFLADMLLATLARDYRRLAQVQVDAGYLPPGQSMDLYAQALRAVCEPIFGRPLARISFARLLGQLFRLTESFNLSVQPQLVLLQKNMLMAEGVSRHLDPSLNIWVLAEPLITDWMRAHRGPQARVRDAGQSMIEGLERLPATLAQMESIVQQAAVGGLRLHPETVAAFTDAKRQAAGIRRAMLLAALALLLAAGALLL
ncbi:2-polyprenylphenol 6-hydroxylase [Aquibaculum arenosum]|uniref:2-polyprenylphenol 6-hydroxylase n=1 Tax=Aquibaculum arenosum TaxID=3032591 RepID=A0ABT5YJW5_9PROT|nr:2-polyprenylphenol 6-hydroxylase [Fodinicurvata sp. CAU 1616]MDF2095240.1 2-polyprenylphenol 6-hydroxylase [Fodinicurvata sp. CAU 1616]